MEYYRRGVSFDFQHRKTSNFTEKNDICTCKTFVNCSHESIQDISFFFSKVNKSSTWLTLDGGNTTVTIMQIKIARFFLVCLFLC